MMSGGGSAVTAIAGTPGANPGSLLNRDRMIYMGTTAEVTTSSCTESLAAPSPQAQQPGAGFFLLFVFNFKANSQCRVILLVCPHGSEMALQKGELQWDMSHQPSQEGTSQPWDTHVSIEPPASEVRADVWNGSF